MRVVLRSTLLSTIAFTLSLYLASCGSVSNPIVSNTTGNSGTGPIPAVTAQAIEINGVAPNRKQEVQFSEAMNPDSINTKTFLITDAGGNQVPGTVTYDSDYNVAMFQPSPALEDSTKYTATITTGAQSVGGMSLAANYSWQFTTRADADSSPITVTSVMPAANAQCISPTTTITITFNEAPDASTVTSANIVVSDSNGNKIPVTVSANVSTTQVVVTAKSPLPSGTITVTVSGIGDLADVLMQQLYTWSFSTACNTGGGGGNSGSAAAIAFVRTSSGFESVTVDSTGKASTGGTQSVSQKMGDFALPASNLLFVASQAPDGTGTATGYSFDANGGSIKQVSSTVLPDFGSLATDATGSTLYVAGVNGSPQAEFYGYKVDASTGNLTPLPGSPWVAGNGYSAGEMAVSPDGKWLCANVQTSESGDSIGCIGRNADGSLNPSKWIEPIHFYMGNEQIAFSTDSQWVLVPDPTNETIDYGSLSDSSQYNKSTPTGGIYPDGIASDPAGKWIAVANLNSSNIAMFSLAANGVLTPGPVVTTPGKPTQIAFSKTGTYLFATTDAGTAVYSVNQTTGALTPVSGSPVAGGTQGPVVAE